MPKILKTTRFGNPILRAQNKRLTKQAILSDEIQMLIANMYHTLTKQGYGVGLAAPQVGVNVQVSTVDIKPTPNRPNLPVQKVVLINPEIIQVYGNRQQMWEGCVSCGTNDDVIYAKVPRYKKVKVRWHDEHATKHEEIFDGFLAHVAQHEIDHLNGTLFVDRVKDSSTFMMADEYRKRIVKKRS